MAINLELVPTVDVRVLINADESYQAQARELVLWINVGPRRESFKEAVDDALAARAGQPPAGSSEAWVIEGEA